MKAKIANEIINNALDRGCGVNVFLSDGGDVSVSIYQPECVLVERECEHEFVDVPYSGQIICKKCGHVLTAEEKRAALEHANALRRAEEAAEVAAEVKCPCDKQKHMTGKDCAKTDCDECCPLRKAAAEEADAE